jgi:hypothetical protein
MMKRLLYSAPLALLLLSSCSGGRFVSADPDLEEIYMGKTYYEIIDDFGYPDASIQDGMEGSKIAYNAVSLNGTRAAQLYRRFNMRNRATKQDGAPVGGLTFSFDPDMKCYAVSSDFQHEKVKQPKAAPAPKPVDRRMPEKVKPQIPRTLDYPYFESRSPFAEAVSIEKIEVERSKITVHFMYRTRTPDRRPVPDRGLYIVEDVYIEDCATGTRYAFVKADGISLYPEETHFAHNQGGYDILVYSLTFEPIGEDVEYINIIEPGHSGYNFFGIDVRTPITTKDELKQQ